MSKTDLISIEQIEKFIYLIRGEKVMLDHDLAELTKSRRKRLIKLYAVIAIDFPLISCSNFWRKKLWN